MAEKLVAPRGPGAGYRSCWHQSPGKRASRQKIGDRRPDRAGRPAAASSQVAASFYAEGGHGVGAAVRVEPDDLAAHGCIGLRFPTHGSIAVWDLERNGRALNVRVEPRLVVNDMRLQRLGAIGGAGLAYIMADYVQADLASGALVQVLQDWCPPFPGYHLYYPSRRQQSAALATVVDALRHRG